MTEQVLPIRLRAMEPEDLDLLYRIENDQELWGVGPTNVPYSRFTLHDYVANNSGDIYTDKQVRLMLENNDGQVVGMADIVNFDAKNQRAELGIVIERQHRRKGYAEAAIKQLSDYGLRVLHLHQLYVYIAADNEASLNLFSKMNYTIAGKLSEWLFDGRSYRDAFLMQLVL